MMRNEPIGVRELSPEEIGGVSGGGAVVGASVGAAGEEYGQAFSGATSLQNTFVATRPVSPVITSPVLAR